VRRARPRRSRRRCRCCVYGPRSAEAVELVRYEGGRLQGKGSGLQFATVGHVW